MSMTEPNTPEVEKPAKPKRKYARRRAASHTPRPAEREMGELEGLTARDCCNACLVSRAAAIKAQQRMNEIDRAYPRVESRNPRSETVMESDAEWLERNPKVAEEWRKLSEAVMGKCVISKAMGCAHPFKGSLPSHLQNDPEVVTRYQRAKKILQHQKISVS